MRIETTSREFAKITGGKLIKSERPKTIIKNLREIIIFGDVIRKKELFLKILDNFIEDFEINSTVKIFISPICPTCPYVVEEVCSIPVKRVEIIDVTDYPEIAQNYNVMATPTVVIDRIKLVGKVNRKEILEWIEKGYDRKEYFAKLLKDGSAEDVFREIIRDEDADVLIELLTYRDFMVRLGAMVVVEELAKKKPDLIIKIKDKIRELLKHEDERIRQDIAMLLGNIGDKSDKAFLKELLREGGDVEESAREAIEEIERKSNNQK